MTTIKILHHRARRAVAAGEAKLRDAAEYLAKAAELGARQKQSAKAIGKSQQWVSQLLLWRKNGYRGGAFERSHKARSTSRASIHAPATPLQVAKLEFQKARADAVARMFGPEIKKIPAASRHHLIKALRALASNNTAERAAATLIVENQRALLNATWDELIVPAANESELNEAA
jgi:hypothetical protein